MFGLPAGRPLPPAAAPLVIVKRARRAPVPPGHALHAAGPPEPPPDKGPRTFRLPAQGPALPAGPEPQPALLAPPAPALRRRRRLDDRRPGPVLQLLAPPPPPPARPDAAAWQALSDDLAALAPVLAAIERAQAFQFMPDDHGAEWRRLQQRAEALARLVRGQRR